MQWKTGAAFALLAALMFTLVGYLSGQQARRQVPADIGGSLQQVAVRLTVSLDTDLYERFREIRNLADLDALLGSPPEPTRWRPVLDKLLPAQPGGEPLRLVDVAAPVVRDGRVAAVLGAHRSLRWADERRRDELTPIEAQRRLEVLVVNGKGELLLDAIDAPGITLPADAIEALDRGGPAVHTWSNGQAYLSTVERNAGFRDDPGLGWQVVVRQPVETAMAQARALER